jgi:hypothetical protein
MGKKLKRSQRKKLELVRIGVELGKLDGQAELLTALDGWLERQKKVMESEAEKSKLGSAGGAYRAFWATQDLVHMMIASMHPDKRERVMQHLKEGTPHIPGQHNWLE